ncbi:MAG: hypothetical protein ACFFCP_12950 [Promethearchaeota archaeon]
MFEDSIEDEDLIMDCKSYELAVKVGFIGVALGIVITVTWQVAYFLFYESSDNDIELIILASSILSPIGFSGAILGSVGFVGIFLMKQSNKGIIFPIIFISNNVLYWIFIRISILLEIYSFELNSLFSVIVGTSLDIIGGLTLLTIRGKSANSTFLAIYAVFYMIPTLLSYLVYRFVYIPPTATGYLAFFLADLPYLLVGFISSFMMITFFVIERRMGCLKRFY